MSASLGIEPSARSAVEIAGLAFSHTPEDRNDPRIVTSVSDAAKFLRAKDAQYSPQLHHSARLAFHEADIPPLAEDFGGEVPRDTAVRAAIGIYVYGPYCPSFVRSVVLHRSSAQRPWRSAACFRA
jgi:hypothetical protein